MTELHLLTGRHLGYSDWLEVTQERVDRFAEVIDDRQWIHVDPERARTSRFGAPIAHGHLILSLTSHLLGQILELSGSSMVVNYGCDRVRFLSPVTVGTRLRAGATLRSVTDFGGGVQLTVVLAFAAEGRRAPVCVASVLLRAYE